MTDNPLSTSLQELTCIQRQAVHWNDSALLVLAGSGSGKTRVLTGRIARLLDSSLDRRFHILALTFTNKAANEMATRVAALVPGLEGLAYIGTFHGFCAQVLRQHGMHLGIKPDFAIYSRTEDRQAVLEDALRRGHGWGQDNFRILPLIDHLKTKLVEPSEAEQHLGKTNRSADAGRIAHAYRLYEEGTSAHQRIGLQFSHSGCVPVVFLTGHSSPLSENVSVLAGRRVSGYQRRSIRAAATNGGS